jgi:hypothetical protein
VSDDQRPGTRASRIETDLRYLRETWLEAGIHPELPEDRARWGEIWRAVEGDRERREARRERLAKILASAVVGIIAASAPLLFPLIARFIGWRG